MPTKMVGLVDRVLMTLPQAQRISAATYLGCIVAFIEARAHNLPAPGGMASPIFSSVHFHRSQLQFAAGAEFAAGVVAIGAFGIKVGGDKFPAAGGAPESRRHFLYGQYRPLGAGPVGDGF